MTVQGEQTAASFVAGVTEESQSVCRAYVTTSAGPRVVSRYSLPNLDLVIVTSGAEQRLGGME